MAIKTKDDSPKQLRVITTKEHGHMYTQRRVTMELLQLPGAPRGSSGWKEFWEWQMSQTSVRNVSNKETFVYV